MNTMESKHDKPAKPHDEQEKQEESPEIQRLPLKEYEALMAKLSELEGMKDRMLRSAADFDNAKKRLAKEKEEFLKFNHERLVRSLLAVLDNLERALTHSGESPSESSALLTGVELVQKQLLEVLKAQGLRRVPTQGQMFDPHLHEAVSFVHEPGKENEIVDEVQAGYFLHDRLLRAPKVRVRAHPPAKSGDGPGPICHPREGGDPVDSR